MAVEPRPTWKTVTLDQLNGMPLWQLQEICEARNRDVKASAEQAAAAKQASVAQQPVDRNNLHSGKNASKSSQGPEATPSSLKGPSRSPKKPVRTHPYTRAEAFKDSNDDVSEANSPPTVIGASSVPTTDYDEVSEETVQELIALIGRLQKELNELEEENNDAVKNVKATRMIAVRLKEKLAYEKMKTDRVIDLLHTWQESYRGWKLADIFFKEDVPADEADIDEEIGAENLARLKRDFEILSKEEFSQLKRRFVEVNKNKKEAEISSEDNGSNINDNDFDGKGKMKETDEKKGKERSDEMNITRPANDSKGKGKAKEDPHSPAASGFSNAKKRLWSQAELQTDPALASCLERQEEAEFAEAQLRSRLEFSSANRAANGSNSRFNEASGSRTRLPEGSGSGIRFAGANGEASRLPAVPIADDEEPRSKRRKVRANKETPGSDSSHYSSIEKPPSFGKHFLGRTLRSGTDTGSNSKSYPTRRYLSIIKLDTEFDDAKEPVFTWDRVTITPNIQLPEPGSADYVSEIQRACRFLWAKPPSNIIPPKTLFKLGSNASPSLTADGPVFQWSNKGVPVIRLPDSQDPNFLPLLLRVGQQLGDYDASIPRSRRTLKANSGNSLHCSWDLARRPVVILPPPEDPKYAEAVSVVAKFILRGPGPGDLWQPSTTGFFLATGKSSPKLSHVAVKVNSKDGSISVELPQHTASDYIECILSANEWIQDLLGDDHDMN